jgi:serine/threonine-protein kinase RIO1
MEIDYSQYLTKNLEESLKLLQIDVLRCETYFERVDIKKDIQKIRKLLMDRNGEL